MATVTKIMKTTASPDEAWDAVADWGSPHLRLVPGFAIATLVEQGARLVTFANGKTVREPIVTLDQQERRLVWAAEGGVTTHYNASLQVAPAPEGGSELRWVADFLPDSATPAVDAAMSAGIAAMKKTLDEASNRRI